MKQLVIKYFHIISNFEIIKVLIEFDAYIDLLKQI